MEVFSNIESMRIWVAGRKKSGRRIGLVPTMGNLHPGHLSLLERAEGVADEVVVSIFVNPAQFLPNEDFERYPRTPGEDLDQCRAAGVAAVFMPDVHTMYAPDASVFVEEDTLSGTLCGRARPGHFRGVLTVVAKLFNIIEPDVAVFGWKDAQQAALIRRMIRDLAFKVRLEMAPVVREKDGLAMSSRNRYLVPAERTRALALKEALDAARSAWISGETASRKIIAIVEHVLRERADVKPEYVACVNPWSLAPVERLCSGDRIVLAAVIGRTRLIDNICLGEGEEPC